MLINILIFKSIIFWDVPPCSLVEANRLFGGTYCLHTQGRRVSKKPEASSNLLLASGMFLAWCIPRQNIRCPGWDSNRAHHDCKYTKLPPNQPIPWDSWAFWPFPIAGSVELVPPSLQRSTLLPSFFRVIIKQLPKNSVSWDSWNVFTIVFLIFFYS
jgi:hypothetical protein